MGKITNLVKNEVSFYKNLRNINLRFIFLLCFSMIILSSSVLAIGLTITDEDRGSFSLTPTTEKIDYFSESDDNLLITLNKFNPDSGSFDIPVKNTFFVKDSKIFKYGALDEDNQGIERYKYSYRSTQPFTYSKDEKGDLQLFLTFEENKILKNYLLDFSDICSKADSQCGYIPIDEYNFEIDFNSDEVIDPIINVSTISYSDVAILALTNQTFVTGSIESGNAILRLYNTTGSLISQATTATGLGSVARVKLTYLNSTSFVTGWYDNNALTKAIQYQLYNFSLSSTSTVQTGLSMLTLITDNVDFSLTANSNTIFLCTANDLTNNNEINIIPSNTLGSGTNVVLDASNAPEATNQQLVSCSVINSTRIRYSYFDDPTNDILAFTINNSGAIINSDSLDSNAGETAQVDNIALRNNLSSTLWYDSSDSNIYMSIILVNGTQILSPVSIDSDAGSDSRVSLATSRWQNKSVFLASWNDRTTNAIQTKVFLENGTNIFFYNITNLANSTQLIFDTYGRNSFLGTGLCNDTFVAIYHNTTGKIVAQTMYVNGTIWDGVCDIPAPIALSSPSIENIAPPNNTLSTSLNITFNATITDANQLKNATLLIYNETGSLISSNSTQLSTNSSFLNFTNILPEGEYFWNFLVYNSQNNTNQTGLRRLILEQSPILNVSIKYPLNTTYLSRVLALNYTVSDPLNDLADIQACWYSLDKGITNTTITCGINVTGLSSVLGSNTWQVYANHTITGDVFSAQVNFVDSCHNIDGTIIASSYPYVDFNTTYLFRIGNFPTNLSNLILNITNPDGTNQSFAMSYNSTLQSFFLNFIFTEIGNYPFIVYNGQNTTCPILNSQISGAFLVRNPYYVTVRGFNNKTIGSPSYINDFAYVTAEFDTRNYNPTTEPYTTFIFFSKYNAPFVFHAPYTNGEATLKLWENTSYQLRLVDGVINFDGTYAYANITKTYGTNVYLGKFPLNQTSVYNVFLSSKDLHPYRWLFNILLIILLILALLMSLGLLFTFPSVPVLALAFGFISVVTIITLRIIVYFWLGN